ncbi:hypothetical protein CMUS01_06741 [Colletotrichum musicola]|uniref:Uncharacterized protein n=1 Tax=Colletotrichum musicola TaxID=2175873 RepID=A0A8H6KKG0_9PEZI|nr:hypothetical protein CMUS01_06741 [Colletotrichum musicola]
MAILASGLNLVAGTRCPADSGEAWSRKGKRALPAKISQLTAVAVSAIGDGAARPVRCRPPRRSDNRNQRRQWSGYARSVVTSSHQRVWTPGKPLCATVTTPARASRYVPWRQGQRVERLGPRSDNAIFAPKHPNRQLPSAHTVTAPPYLSQKSLRYRASQRATAVCCCTVTTTTTTTTTTTHTLDRRFATTAVVLSCPSSSLLLLLLSSSPQRRLLAPVNGRYKYQTEPPRDSPDESSRSRKNLRRLRQRLALLRRYRPSLFLSLSPPPPPNIFG